LNELNDEKWIPRESEARKAFFVHSYMNREEKGRKTIMKILAISLYSLSRLQFTSSLFNKRSLYNTIAIAVGLENYAFAISQLNAFAPSRSTTHINGSVT